MSLFEKIKDLYISAKERMNDINTIRHYDGLNEKLNKLEERGHIEHYGECGELLIFSKKYSRIMDKIEGLREQALAAMRRESDRLKARYN